MTKQSLSPFIVTQKQKQLLVKKTLMVTLNIYKTFENL